MRYVEDPSIAQCAAVEFDRVWERIEAGVREGEPFFVAREKILALEIPVMAKRYGKTVGDRVAKVVQSKDRDDLSRRTQEILAARLRQDYLEDRLKRRGGKLTVLDRIAFKFAIGGIPLW